MFDIEKAILNTFSETLPTLTSLLFFIWPTICISTL
uniref:Uncharacterized protein n=1 Tax=Lepeophtheirus salmonis TaxID=72036 RepID=A0A0K2TSX8_LEPSM